MSVHLKNKEEEKTSQLVKVKNDVTPSPEIKTIFFFSFLDTSFFIFKLPDASLLLIAAMLLIRLHCCKNRIFRADMENTIYIIYIWTFSQRQTNSLATLSLAC